MNYIFIGGVLSWIGDKIQGFFYYILLWLNAIIYSIISFVYQIFLTITSNEGILDDSVINGFVDRLYIIIGVVTLFIIAYSLLKSMINPDEALKGKKSPVNIIKDVIISIALITLLPTIFDFAFEVQNSVLTYNTIGKLILGSNGNTTNENDISQGGYTIAATVWQSFFYPDEKYCTIDQENAGDTSCEILPVGDTTWAGIWNEAADNRTFFGVAGIGGVIMSGDVTYLFIFDILVGVYVLFVLGIYCMDMAVRLVKLSVYQIIAPLPILARIVPNESVSKVFSNWLKATISTFVEVFIRVALLFFAVIIIQSAVRSIDNVFVSNFSGSASIMVKGVAQVLIVLGIIKFTKEAPALIKEITGLDGGKYGKSLIQGAGMLLGGMGTVGTTAIRTAAKNYNDAKNNGGNKWKAAAGGFLKSAAMQKGFLKGAWGGRKVEKFGDIPKATSKSISAYAAQQRSIEQKGGGVTGWYEYQKAMAGLRKEKAVNWIQGGATEDTRAQQAINEMTKLLDDIEQVFKRDPGYNKSKEEYMQAAGLKTSLEESIRAATSLNGQAMTINGQTVTGADIVTILNDKNNRFSAQEKADAEALADQLAQQERGQSYISAAKDAKEKKANLEGIELTVKKDKSKSNQIASIVNEFQGAFARYDDLEFADLQKLVDTNIITSNERDIIKRMPQLNTPGAQAAFAKRLQDGDQEALDYLKIINRVKDNMKNEAANITRRQNDRKAVEEQTKKEK